MCFETLFLTICLAVSVLNSWLWKSHSFTLFLISECICNKLCSRYSAVRRQFGPPGQEEIPVLEYQMQVSKLMPV